PATTATSGVTACARWPRSAPVPPSARRRAPCNPRASRGSFRSPLRARPDGRVTDEGQKPGARFRAAALGRLLVLGLVGLYVLFFIVLNTRHVKVSFVLGSARVSLIWVILLALAAGVVLGAFSSRLRRHRQGRR